MSILFDFYDGKKIWYTELTLIPVGQGGGENSAPQIMGWKVEELEDENSFFDKYTEKSFLDLNAPIGPITYEHFLRFWVFVSDPDGDHAAHLNNGFEFEPELKLTNLVDDSDTGYIKMKWAGKGFDPYSGVDAYFVDILPSGSYTYDYEDFESIDFTPGLWKFKFKVEDNCSASDDLDAETNIGDKKIWCTGDPTQMWNYMMYGYDATGETLNNLLGGFNLPVMPSIVQSIGVMVGYAAAGITSTLGPKGRIAGRLVATGIAIYDLANTGLGWWNLINTDDTGALLGLALSSIISAAGLALVHVISTTGAGKSIGWDAKGKCGKYNDFNIGNLKILRNLASVMFLLQFMYFIIVDPGSVLGLVGIQDGDEIPWNDIGWLDPNTVKLLKDFGKLPMEIMSLIFSTIGLGAILNIASMKDTNVLGAELGEDGSFQGLKPLHQVNPVIKIAKYHVIFKACLSALCFTSFMYKTGMFQMLQEYRFINDPTVEVE